MPLLSHTVILPNNPSALLYMDFVDEYLRKELLASRMSSPFSHEETELILHGPFQLSPLIMAVQSWCARQTSSLSAFVKIHESSSFHELIHPQSRFSNKIRPCVKGHTHGELLLSSFSPPLSLTFYVPFCILCMGLPSFVCYMQFLVFALQMCYLDIMSLLKHLWCFRTVR